MSTTEMDNIIRERFFKALREVISRKMIRGKKTFCDDHAINRGTFYYVEKGTYAFTNPSWLTYLVSDFKVSPLWLLTGRGNMFM